jgi:hypothetical protein
MRSCTHPQVRATSCAKLNELGGAVAQLGARLDGIEEVVGSNPIGSTNLLSGRSLGPAALFFSIR